jgi:prepilin-type N-terminal cleavage/methylation domain-containing protein
MKKLNSSGFTLIELMLAMTLFSAVMVVATVGFIGMNRSFARGVIRKELSEATQAANESVTRSIRAQGVTVVPQSCNEVAPNPDCYPGWSAVCLGQVRYLWQNSGGGDSLYKDSAPSCSSAPSSTKERILSERYKAQKFEIIKDPVKQGLFRVKGVFSTKDPDALTMTDDDIYTLSCKGSSSSASVSTCAVEKFSFVVNARGLE